MVAVKCSEAVHLGFSDIATVDQVENLKENKRVKDQGEMFHFVLSHIIICID